MDIDQKSLSSKIKGVWELPDILHQIKVILIRASSSWFSLSLCILDRGGCVCLDMRIKLAREGQKWRYPLECLEEICLDNEGRIDL